MTYCEEMVNCVSGPKGILFFHKSLNERFRNAKQVCGCIASMMAQDEGSYAAADLLP